LDNARKGPQVAEISLSILPRSHPATGISEKTEILKNLEATLTASIAGNPFSVFEPS
jgi:hypothetical protein